MSKVAVDNGLNPNLVRKWIARVEREDASQVRLLPVVVMHEPIGQAMPIWRHVAEVRLGDAVILVGESASSEVESAIVRALR